MVMKEISITEARKIADQKSLKPGMIKGTQVVQFTKGKSAKVEVIDWMKFENLIKSRKLSILNSGGFMKIMAKK